ncbi:hypothetical protein ACQ7BX_02020, partial [Escherichia coli]
ARNGGKNSLNRLIRCVCGKKIGPDPRNFNQRVNLGRNDLLIRTFPKPVIHNKDWRFKRFAVELPPSLRVTKVVNHKPRIGKPSVAFTWDRVKN